MADLARVAATSRTVLTARFSQTVGLPPMQYLTEWRLQLAAERLATGSTAAWRRMRRGQSLVTAAT